MALAVACAATFVPSAQAGPPVERVELVVERVAPAGAASFRLDLLVEPGEERGFVGGVAFKLDGKGRPSNTTPLLMTSLNERREPAAQSGGVTVSTCSVGVCRTGRTVAGSMTVVADDQGPTDTPTIVLVARGAGRVTLTGGPMPVAQTCPIDSGYLASGTDRRTSWSLSGPVVGDVRGRMARLLIVDLPLRKIGAKTAP
jgi:hypothetical protein